MFTRSVLRLRGQLRSARSFSSFAQAPRFTSKKTLALSCAGLGVGALWYVNSEEQGSACAANSAGHVSVYEIPLGDDFPDSMPSFIEVAKGSRNKYEWDNDLGFLRLDRVLHSAVFYPHNYGFIPQTLCKDGDALDVLVLGEECVPGSIVDIRPLGYMIMEDEKGLDEKVLAVPTHDPRFAEYRSLRDVPEHLLREIAHFFDTYKALEKKKWAKVGGWKGTEDTKLLIQATHQFYKTSKKQKSEQLEGYNAEVYEDVQKEALETYNDKVYDQVKEKALEKYNSRVYDKVKAEALEHYNGKVYKSVKKEVTQPLEEYNEGVYENVKEEALERYNTKVYDKVQKAALEGYNDSVYKMVRRESAKKGVEAK